MISWLVGVVVCIALLMGCNGGQKGNLVKADQIQPEMTAAVTDDGPGDASLTEELSAKRLEELYAKSGINGLDPSLEEALKNWEHQVKFDVPIQMNKQVRAYLVYFSTERKAVITRYLARSTRYLPMIKEVFQEAGLPEDLAYLAMIESGFNNRAYSPAAACGMWQFIKGTGLRYGLAIDSYVDERRDPEKATRAAAQYLLDLYKQFGSWYLAAASYNCGEGRVQRELNQSNHKNFWELSANMCLPTETKNYVPQMIAATIIAKNPEKFGFKNVPYLPPVKYDKVPVTETTSLTAASVAVNVPPDEVQDLNPELLRGITPPDVPSYTLNLPPSSKEKFLKNITIARIEHPAVASHPIRTARSSRKSYSSDKSSSNHQASVVHKSHGKSRSSAKASTKAAKRTYAKQGKPTHSTPVKAGAAPVVQASLFGTPSLASKSSDTKKTKTALIGTAKGKKSGEARLAKKSNNTSKSTAKSKKAGSSNSRAKDKYSRSKSKRAIMVSEAR
ncbi:MAG: transglycosylase SLT domain-containing protein [Deltaproteobacteria bacterium]|nr:transglycosylase SLT domain-containing protein [Deltaproteobacteria bacterium]